jgi:AraC family cel operon transcriptional repressor
MRLPQKIFRIDTYLDAATPSISSARIVPDTPPVLEHSHDFFELMMVEQGAGAPLGQRGGGTAGSGTLVFLRPSDSPRAAIAWPGRARAF